MRNLTPTIIALLSGAAFSTSATAGVVATLGTPTDTKTSIGDHPSWNTIGDTQDATFTSYIDFSPNTGNFQTIWETGDGALGSSLIYGPGNTLFFRVRDGSTLTDISWNLTANQLSAGELFVAWVIDLGNNELRLFMDGLDAANNTTQVAMAPFAGTDWSGNGLAGYGATSSPVGGYTGFVAALVGDPFTSGTINTTEGLDFYQDQAFLPSPVPEPMGALAGVAAIGFTCLRRRRDLV